MRNIHRPRVSKRDDGSSVVSCPCGWTSEHYPSEAVSRSRARREAEEARNAHLESVWTCSVCGTKVSSTKNGWDRWGRPDGGVDHARCHGGETKEQRQLRHLQERREQRNAERSFTLRGDDRYGKLGP